MQDYDDFKVGDDVWCILYGKGKVQAVKEQYTYPVLVKFEAGHETWYTHAGKLDHGGNRILFFSEPKIEASVKRPFVPTLLGKTVVVETPLGDACGKVLEETLTHFKLECGRGSFMKALCIAVYEVSSKNLLEKK